MLEETVRQIADEQGWTAETLVSLLTRFIDENVLDTQLVDYLSDIADKEEGL